MEKLENNLQEALDLARQKGLKSAEIRIKDGDFSRDDFPVVLWSGGLDRMGAASIEMLEEMLNEHDNLEWMNR